MKPSVLQPSHNSFRAALVIPSDVFWFCLWILKYFLSLQKNLAPPIFWRIFTVISVFGGGASRWLEWIPSRCSANVVVYLVVGRGSLRLEREQQLGAERLQDRRNTSRLDWSEDLRLFLVFAAAGFHSTTSKLSPHAAVAPALNVSTDVRTLTSTLWLEDCRSCKDEKQKLQRRLLSQPSVLTSGVPQGSVSEPLQPLFLRNDEMSQK